MRAGYLVALTADPSVVQMVELRVELRVVKLVEK
jgi:hypothetical protein